MTSEFDRVTEKGNTPAFLLEIDNKDISERIQSRLMSLTMTDNRGFEADQLDIELDDADGTLMLPSRGNVISLALGWRDQPLINKGRFTVDEIEHSGAPDKLTIRARSADFRESLNMRREESYHEKRIGDIVRTIAARNKLTADLHKDIEQVFINHIDQTNESDSSFLTRLANQEGAIASVKNGKLIFIRQGQNKTASGQIIPALVITRQLGDSHNFTLSDRDAYTGVVANWLDTRKPERKHTLTVKRKNQEYTDKSKSYLVGSKDNALELSRIYADEVSAKRAAKVVWEKIQRGTATFSIQLARGRADLYPEIPIKVTGFKPEIDNTEWTLTTVTHTMNGSGGGFTTVLVLELKIDDLDMK
ncbi:phage late control D family protein [Photorhabdus khanii]|uniref:Phage late control D family protein n=1 Tax=Photorhabdus khanii TaxID=1004150 RepID=A0A7C9GRY5_9GAMM|nr:phage late control D family protein [Photorhabdus khanii]MQL50399.1 phage late control D family protein [Photorhabdus khanii]